MKNRTYLSAELFILFILIPISLLFSYPFWAKAGLVIIGFIYVVVVMFKHEDITFEMPKKLDWKSFWKRTIPIFLGITIITTFYVYFVAPEKLFCLPINKPGLWLVTLLIYSVVSVWPQEIIYRTFFFARYERLFKNEKMLIFINAIIFSLAHLFFQNTLVLIISFLGGILFGLTYYRTRSTMLVSIEHVIYGSWLVTVGMGQMFYFPGMGTC